MRVNKSTKLLACTATVRDGSGFPATASGMMQVGVIFVGGRRGAVACGLGEAVVVWEVGRKMVEMLRTRGVQ